MSRWVVVEEQLQERDPLSAAEEIPPQDKLLPMRLTPFSPPDRLAEEKTNERLQRMTFSQLRSRRSRIDKRLFELGLSLGEPSLAIPSVRGTGLIDLDRILRKIDKLEYAREETRMVREANRKEKPISAFIDLDWLSEAFRGREIRTRKNMLVSELGLALAASDQRALAKYATHVKELLEQHVPTARRIDELFVEMRLVDDEFGRRAREGQEEEPKEIDAMLALALDSVDDVSSKVGGAVADFGKSAAKTAVQGGGQAVWELARGAAKGAWALGSRSREEEEEDDEEPIAPPEEGSDGVWTKAQKAARGAWDFGSRTLTGKKEEAEDPETIEVKPLAPPSAGPRARARREIPQLIRQLAKLHEDGILTEDEFKDKKAELLSRL